MLEVWFQVGSKTLLVLLASFYFSIFLGNFLTLVVVARNLAMLNTKGYYRKNQKKFRRKSSQRQYQLQIKVAWGLIWRCHMWRRFLWFHIQSHSRYLKVLDTCSYLLPPLLIFSYRILSANYKYFFYSEEALRQVFLEVSDRAEGSTKGY